MIGKKVVFLVPHGEKDSKYEEIIAMLHGHGGVRCDHIPYGAIRRGYWDCVVNDGRVWEFAQHATEHEYQDAADAYDLVLGCLYG